MSVRRYGFGSRAQAVVMRDALRAAGVPARLFGRWNVNGGGVRAEYPEGVDVAAVEAAAREAVYRAAVEMREAASRPLYPSFPAHGERTCGALCAEGRCPDATVDHYGVSS